MGEASKHKNRKSDRKKSRPIILLFTVVFFVCSNTTNVIAEEIPITIDGYFDDWNDKPYSWEYKTNNTAPFSLANRHKMWLYRDVNNVYLHIIMCDQNLGFSGNDFFFWVDGQQVEFLITFVGGTPVYGNTSSKAPGIYTVEVRQWARNKTTTVFKTQAKLVIKAGDKNDELEIMIPFVAMERQNRNIDVANGKVVEFFSPNLMYRHIVAAGTPTGSILSIGIGAALVLVAWRIRKGRGRKEKA